MAELFCVRCLYTTMTDFEKVQIPPQSKDDSDWETDRLKLQYGKYFRNREQFEFFCMLPLSTDEQRKQFFDRWLEIEKSNKAIDEKNCEPKK